MYMNTTTVKFLVAAAVMQETVDWHGTKVKVLDATIHTQCHVVELSLGIGTQVWAMRISQKTDGKSLFWDWYMTRQ